MRGRMSGRNSQQAVHRSPKHNQVNQIERYNAGQTSEQKKSQSFEKTLGFILLK